ncbi:MAG TPA: PstS family phosphate ABC transporter substrate-binding protein [Methylothermaceae bacterium]|nr:PstS family phosphate ABC transporter substrate-binding protein [Methylothermaceae bacterium]
MKALIFLLWSFILTGNAGELIRVAGSSTVLPVIAEAARHYHTAHPDVSIAVSGGGSGVGIATVLQGGADLGMSSREPTPAEWTRLRQRRIRLVAIGRDGIAVAVSKAVVEGGVDALSLAQIAAIYRGEIRNWKTLGGPDRTILVIDKERGRGTRHVFAKVVLGHAMARAPGASVVAGSNNEMQALIGRSDNAIGMLSYAWLNDKVRGLPLRINGRDIPPAAETIRNGGYPLRRDLFLLVPETARAAVIDFVQFLLSPKGQSLVRQCGYLPLP